MKKLLIILLSALSLIMSAQNEVKRIAILETVDQKGDVNLGTKVLLRQSITFGINHIPGYEAYNRVNTAQIIGEQNFQRTGLVSDKDIKKIGEFTGAAYVLIAEAVNYDASHILVLANLVDVETGRVTNSSIPKVASIDPEKMYADCAEVAKTLLGISTIGGNNSISQNNITLSYEKTPIHQDFTEEAWGINMKMIWVEGGEFMMGCTSEQGDACSDDEKNVRRVTIDGFYIGMLEVTQAQFEKVMDGAKQVANPSMFADPERPVERVCYRDAIWFCRRLSNKTGKKYLLPTEAQWEYAARGGIKNEKTIYSGSNQIDAVAWYKDNAEFTSPCGTKMPNALGIYDMSGNVFEWCRDWYAYKCYDTNNPTGPSEGSERVVRGGSIFHPAGGCRITNRASRTPDYSKPDVGFRVVCIP